MAKRTPLFVAPATPPQPLEEILDESNEDENPEPEMPDDDNVKLNEFLQFFGGKEYKVRVEEFDKEEKLWLHLDTYPVDGFEPFETCKRFGPGRYRMTFLNDKGRYVKGGQPQIRIGGKALAAVIAAAPQAQDSNPLNNPLVLMMLANAKEASAQNGELLKALLMRPEPAKSSTNEVMDLLIKLKSMNPTEKTDDSMKKLSEALMMKMIERGMDDNGGGDGGGGILSDIKDAMPIIKEVLAARAPQRQLPPATTQGPRVVTNNPSLEVPAVENPLMDGLKPYISIFKAKAENNGDQERAAQFLIDELYDSVIPLIKKHITLASMASDESVLESLVSRAKDPAQVEALFVSAPELLPHREWVTSVINKAVSVIETPEVEA